MRNKYWVPFHYWLLTSDFSPYALPVLLVPCVDTGSPSKDALCLLPLTAHFLLLSQQQHLQHPAEGKDILRVPLAEQDLPGHPSHGRVASGLCNEKVGE